MFQNVVWGVCGLMCVSLGTLDVKKEKKNPINQSMHAIIYIDWIVLCIINSKSNQDVMKDNSMVESELNQNQSKDKVMKTRRRHKAGHLVTLQSHSLHSH